MFAIVCPAHVLKYTMFNSYMHVAIWTFQDIHMYIGCIKKVDRLKKSVPLHIELLNFVQELNRICADQLVLRAL